MEIQNLNTLGEQITKVDTATLVNLKVIQNNVDLQNFRGVWNVTQDRISNVVSKNYRVIQHSDVIKGVVDSLSRLNMDVKGLMKTYNDTLRLDLIFQDDQNMITDDKTGIKLGIRVLNSYNKTTSFRLEMFGYRMICSNGMALGKAMNSVKEVTFHTGVEKTRDMISEICERFVNDVINSSEKLKAYVESCMQDSIEWESFKEIFPKMMKTKKHRKAIFEIIGDKEKITRWELYNAFTNYATHNTQITPNVEGKIQTVAQKILVTPSEELLANYAEVA